MMSNRGIVLLIYVFRFIIQSCLNTLKITRLLFEATCLALGRRYRYDAITASL